MGHVMSDCTSQRAYIATEDGGYVSASDVEDEYALAANLAGNGDDHENKSVFVPFSVTNNLQVVENHAEEEHELMESLTPLVENEDKEMDALTSSEESQKGKEHGAIIAHGTDLVLQQDIEQPCEYIPAVVQSFDIPCVDLNEPCADLNSHNFAHVELITHKEVFDRISPADALCTRVRP